MKTKFWIILSLQVIILFVTAMLVSFIPELFPKFFGDYYETSIYTKEPELNWGWRHILFCFMGVVLFFIQVARIIIYTYNYEKETKKNT